MPSALLTGDGDSGPGPGLTLGDGAGAREECAGEECGCEETECPAFLRLDPCPATGEPDGCGFIDPPFARAWVCVGRACDNGGEVRAGTTVRWHGWCWTADGPEVGKPPKGERVVGPDDALACVAGGCFDGACNRRPAYYLLRPCDGTPRPIDLGCMALCAWLLQRRKQQGERCPTWLVQDTQGRWACVTADESRALEAVELDPGCTVFTQFNEPMVAADGCCDCVSAFFSNAENDPGCRAWNFAMVLTFQSADGSETREFFDPDCCCDLFQATVTVAAHWMEEQRQPDTGELVQRVTVDESGSGPQAGPWTLTRTVRTEIPGAGYDVTETTEHTQHGENTCSPILLKHAPTPPVWLPWGGNNQTHWLKNSVSASCQRLEWDQEAEIRTQQGTSGRIVSRATIAVAAGPGNCAGGCGGGLTVGEGGGIDWGGPGPGGGGPGPGKGGGCGGCGDGGGLVVI